MVVCSPGKTGEHRCSDKKIQTTIKSLAALLFFLVVYYTLWMVRLPFLLFQRFMDVLSLDGQRSALTVLAAEAVEVPLWIDLTMMSIPLHFGNYGGPIIKILYFILGLTPGLLSITGFILWTRKKKKL